MSNRQLSKREQKRSHHPLEVFFQDLFPQYYDSEKSDWEGGQQNNWHPEMNIQEGKEDFVVSLDLPGLQETDVDMNYANGRLVIKGERKQATVEDNYKEHLRERKHGSFERSVVLGSKVDAEAISAHFSNGVLVVSLPKRSEVLPRKIEIKG